jgi:DNA-binding response OmpR family regulator
MTPNPLRILWVEDDLAGGRHARVELRRRGARVLHAASSERAIELAELFSFDLFVLSGDLGAAEPVDLAAHFRSVFPDSEIILQSSKPQDALGRAGLGLLYSGTGPLAPEMLLDLIHSAFPGRLEARVPSASRPATVLCVDDDPRTLRALSRLLTRHGYRARTIENSEVVMDVIPEVSPDLAILDVLMPGIDGCALARRIHDVYHDLIPMVILSARASGPDVAGAYRDGAKAYLAKPCRPERLLDVVDYYAGDLDTEEREALESEPWVRVAKVAGVIR